MTQTFWQKNKVIITGFIGAIIMALLPVLQNLSEPATIASIAMAVVTAASSWIANNIRGKAQSISGILLSVATIVLPVVFAHGKLDWQALSYIILTQVAAQFFGYSVGPFKPASYEHNATIVEAKSIPPVDQVPLPDSEKQIP